MAIRQTREEKEAKLASKIDIRYRKYTYANFILRMEYRSFGWAYCGNDIEEVDDGYETTVYDNYATTRHKSHIVKYACFKRPRSYQKNFLFSLLELLSSIFSRLRVLAISFIWIAIGICVLVNCGGEEASINTTYTVVGIIYGVLIFGSILIAILGSVTRNVCKLDEKTDEFNAKYGYQGQTDFIKENDKKYN